MGEREPSNIKAPLSPRKWGLCIRAKVAWVLPNLLTPWPISCPIRNPRRAILAYLQKRRDAIINFERWEKIFGHNRDETDEGWGEKKGSCKTPTGNPTGGNNENYVMSYLPHLLHFFFLRQHESGQCPMRTSCSPHAIILMFASLLMLSAVIVACLRRK